MTHLSLFSGGGGLDIAAGWAGLVTIGLCEWGDYQSALLAQRFPSVAKWKDIHELTKEDFYRKTGLYTVDVISGGFPCQPFSTAGQRRGTADHRYLWPQMLRVVNEIRPTWVVAENVAGILSVVQPDSITKVDSSTIARYPDYDYYEGIYTRQETVLIAAILQSLAEIQYDVQVFDFPAAGVGARHRRERIAIIGYNTEAG